MVVPMTRMVGGKLLLSGIDVIWSPRKTVARESGGEKGKKED